MELIGTTIGNKYRVLAHLESGGMGHVYRGQVFGTMAFSRAVALKTLRAMCANDEQSRALFVREARACARLQHRNIVSVLDFERTDTGQLVLVMEYVDGLDLGALVQAEKKLPIGACIYITIEVLRALAHAHERDVVHRDVKPRNILIARTGEVKLTDFGMSKISDQSSVDLIPGKRSIKGTIGYLSPEVVRHEPVDARTDLFTVGVTLYGLLTGHLPFGKSGITSTTARMFNGEVLEPRRLRRDIPDALNAIVMRLLRENPAERYPCARDVIDALSACAASSFTIEDMAALISAHMARMDRARAEHDADPDATQRQHHAPSSDVRVQRESPARAPMSPRGRYRRVLAHIAMLMLAFAAGALLLGPRDHAVHTSAKDASATESPAPPLPAPSPVEPPPEPSHQPTDQRDPIESPAQTTETTHESRPAHKRPRHSRPRAPARPPDTQPGPPDDRASWMPGINTKRARSRD